MKRQPLSDLMPLVGLDQPLVNAGTEPKLKPLHTLREEAVQSAREHMKQARAQRRDVLTPLLKESNQKLRAWEKRKRAEVEARKAKATERGKAMRADIAQRLRAQEQEIDHQIAARKKWLTDTLSTVDLPYLRIGAVLIAAKGDK